jgi:deoxycytidylate deaminase
MAVTGNVRSKSKLADNPSVLEPLPGPELFFGLVGPVGTNLDLVVEVLSNQLSQVKYISKQIRLSELLDDIPGLIKKKPKTRDDRYQIYMDAGNKLRRKSGRNDALALLSVIKIRGERRRITGSPDIPAGRHAYILRSLKNEAEIDSLRKIYGRAFYLIAAYSPRNVRIDTLSHEIAASYHDSSAANYRSHAENILNRDESEEEDASGQHVRDVFPRADIFIDTTSRQTISDSIGRFVDLIFGHPFITPTHSEFNMFLAKAAAFRSADLSRQVGAVIATAESDIIGVGCNEVPKAFGGQYWPSDADDHRDFTLGCDPSAEIKREMLGETFFRLQKAGWLSPQKAELDVTKLVSLATSKGTKGILRGSQHMNIIEFGRIVHAEMAALIDAARRGNAVKGAILYCTTFPCHMCARHIIGAGISKVVYIEPYPKSKVADLYNDSASIDDGLSHNKVSFIPFVGISPTRYQEIFSMPKRKRDDGKIIEWKRSNASPRLERIVESYIFVEKQTNAKFGPKVRNLF